MSVGTKRIQQPVLAVLSTGQIEGNAFRITAGQLDRKLYVSTNEALEALGGTWNRKAKAHVFESDPTDVIEAAIETGEYVDAKKELGFFETPSGLGVTLATHADLAGRHRLLEPSAGRGALILAAERQVTDGFAHITAIDIDKQHAARLSDLANDVLVCDFLELMPVNLDYFDRIVMNPPFARQQDIDHVLHAWDFLDDDGKLVAIMSAGWTFRQNRKSVEFQDFVNEHGWFRANPEGSFLASGTNVNTVMVVLEKS